MILIPCPHCGPRNSTEFRHAGEVTPRPDPGTADPAEWRAYLYLRRNPAGWTRETWFHRMGCRRHFVLERDTVTNQTRPPAATAATAAAAAGSEVRPDTAPSGSGEAARNPRAVTGPGSAAQRGTSGRGRPGTEAPVADPAPDHVADQQGARVPPERTDPGGRS